MFINYLKYKLIYFFNYFNNGSTRDDFEKSKRKALNMNWRNQKPNPALRRKMNLYYIYK